jgi:hypothetical protein
MATVMGSSARSVKEGADNVASKEKTENNRSAIGGSGTSGNNADALTLRTLDGGPHSDGTNPQILRVDPPPSSDSDRIRHFQLALCWLILTHLVLHF